MNVISNDSNTQSIIGTFVLFGIICLVLLILVVYIFKRLKQYVKKTPSKIDDFILGLFRVPVLWLLFWVLFKIFAVLSLDGFSFSSYIYHINDILLILSIAWILTKLVQATSYYLQGKLDIGAVDNLNARKSLTQIKVFKVIINSIIVFIAIGLGLLTFEQARTIGLSLLTSAGIIGIIVGFAAQKSIGMILAGIQLAITQPIRLDDVVIVEGEWGRIEEITLTFVVVKIWDERRLILPVNYFLEKPFQNWTRTNADITGSIFLYLDYSFPVESIRNILPELLNELSDWDGRILNVQVTKTTEKHKEIRILLSSTDASKNWDLRATIREKLIDFINTNYPNTFAKIRIKTF